MSRFGRVDLTGASGLGRLAVPALVIGVGSSLTLLAMSKLADWLQHLLWTRIPSALGVDGSGWGWILLVLPLAGLAVGLVVWKAPGHAGPDPATQSLVSPPMPIGVLPSVAAAVIIGLAGGVSLGPENPIMAINIGLVVALGPRLVKGVAPPQWVMLAAAATIGALFGTPVAAALVMSEMPSGPEAPPLWDRLFAPLAAAGAGAATTAWLAQPSFAIDVAPYRGVAAVDVISGSLIALAAVGVGLIAVYSFPHVHRLFHQITNPVAMLTLGGLVLGVIGAIGGPITLFKGLSEMKELAAHASSYSDARLALIIVVKLAALVIAASCGFRGGRIFPAVFLGVAIGLLANALVPSVPPALAVVAAVMGILMVITRDGWLSIFTAAIVVPDLRLLPILCIITLPVWLIVTDRPEMLIAVPAPPAEKS
jgi:H+/Cl- antiporter ClcA